VPKERGKEGAPQVLLSSSLYSRFISFLLVLAANLDNRS
jgi:hypothetical protein